jgi:hypothetical protein
MSGGNSHVVRNKARHRRRDGFAVSDRFAPNKRTCGVDTFDTSEDQQGKQ